MSFKDKVVYQIYPKSFCDLNNDGVGDIKGIISKLDYLKLLNIDYIWFNPMFVSPQNDNGYDISDYRNFDPIFGTMEDFELLVKECQKRNINIMFDMVFNHTSTNHMWFQKALEGDAKYKDYYIFKKGKDNKTPPTNWQSKFGGSAWEYVEKYDEYYLHLFDKTQADLNWENPNVRQEMADIINYWRDKGVKGFRFDVVNLISKSSFEDDPHLFDGRQFYTDQEKVHKYIKELNQRSYGNDKDGLTVAELSDAKIKNCILYAGEDTHEFNTVFNFHHLKVDYKDKKKWELQPFDFKELKELFDNWQTSMQENNAWNALFWNCHDQPRALSRFGDDKNYPLESGKMLATAIHLLRGVPFIYQGEEIGMTNAYFDDISKYRDVESINIFNIKKNNKDIYKVLQERSRDNARTIMQWDNSQYAGFSNATPWIDVNENKDIINVENELKDTNSIFYTYQKLIQLRKQYKVIQEGLFKMILKDHPKVFAYTRELDNEIIYVFNNFYSDEITLNYQLDNNYEVLLSNYKDTLISKEITLRPYESFVLYYKK